MEYGKYYCVNVDKAVFRGFREDTSRTKDFNFHTAHLYYSLKRELIRALGDIGEIIATDALEEYIQRFGQEYFDAFKEYETLFMKED